VILLVCPVCAIVVDRNSCCRCHRRTKIKIIFHRRKIVDRHHRHKYYRGQLAETVVVTITKMLIVMYNVYVPLIDRAR